MSENKRTLSFGQIFQYGAGGMFTYGFQLVLVGYFLNYFMTDVLFIPTVMAATLNVIIQWLKVFTMLFAGIIMDATVLKWGKYRSWYLICGIVMGVTLPLTFLNLGLNSVTAGIVFIICYAIMMTAYNVGWTALRTLAGMLGKTGNDAVILGSASNVAGTMPSILYMFIGTALLSIPMPFLKDVPNPYFMFALLSGVIIFIGGFVIFNLAKECDGPVVGDTSIVKENKPKAEKVGLLSMIKNLKGPGLVYILAYTFSCAQGGTFSVLLPYYCTYVLKNPTIIMSTIGINAGVAMIGSFFVPAIAKKFGKKQCFIAYHLITAILYIVLAMAKGSGTGFVVVRAIQTFVGCFGICLLPSFMADIADYNEMNGEKGARAFLQSIGGTAARLGSSISAIIGSFGLAVIGYTAGCEITGKIISGFTTLLIIIPGICCAAACAIMLFYKIDEKQLNEYRLNK